MRRAVTALAVAALALVVPTAALAGESFGDVIHVGNVKVKPPTTSSVAGKGATAHAGVAAAAAESPPVGTKKLWPVINFVTGGADFEQFTLRAVGEKIEIWVSDTLDFPAGDCRNDGVRNVITDAQATYFARPVRREHVPEDDGRLQLAALARRQRRRARAGGVVPPGYYAGPGDKIVTLVANFRDENYTDIDVPVLRRRLPLVRHQRVRRAQRDVGRLVRLGAPHRRQPAERAVDRDLRQPPGAAVQVRGHLRPRVPAPARVLGEPRRG